MFLYLALSIYSLHGGTEHTAVLINGVTGEWTGGGEWVSGELASGDELSGKLYECLMYYNENYKVNLPRISIFKCICNPEVESYIRNHPEKKFHREYLC